MSGTPIWDRSFGRATPIIALPHWMAGEPDEATERLLHDIIDSRDRTIRVDAENVADWCLEHPGTAVDGDGLTPPWPRCWVEWPSHADGDHGIRGGEGIAFWVETEPADSPVVATTPLPAGTAWQVTGVGPFWLVDGQVHGPMGSFMMVLDAEGQQVGEFGAHPLAWMERMLPGAESWRQFFAWFRSVSAVTMMTFKFANCRNVELVEQRPTRQQRRARERRGELESVWHTLVINPNLTRRLTVAERGCAADSPAKRLHICRGHFATYTEERPLFGRYAGRFWVPAHVRGLAEAGIVHKGYTASGGAFGAAIGALRKYALAEVNGRWLRASQVIAEGSQW